MLMCEFFVSFFLFFSNFFIIFALIFSTAPHPPNFLPSFLVNPSYHPSALPPVSISCTLHEHIVSRLHFVLRSRPPATEGVFCKLTVLLRENYLDFLLFHLQIPLSRQHLGHKLSFVLTARHPFFVHSMSLLIFPMSLLVFPIALLIFPMSLLIFPMSLLVFPMPLLIHPIALLVRPMSLLFFTFHSSLFT